MAATVAVLAAATAFSATPVLATTTYSGYFPGGDYFGTTVDLGNMYWNSFNVYSSTIVWGSNPYYPYITQDNLTVNVNGWDITISAPPSGHVVSYTQAVFNCQEEYTGVCSNSVYDMTVLGGIWWNNTASDWSMTILYPNTSPLWHNLAVTNWCC